MDFIMFLAVLALFTLHPGVFNVEEFKSNNYLSIQAVIRVL